jgi:hypothetical protein
VVTENGRAQVSDAGSDQAMERAFPGPAGSAPDDLAGGHNDVVGVSYALSAGQLRCASSGGQRCESATEGEKLLQNAVRYGGYPRRGAMEC